MTATDDLIARAQAVLDAAEKMTPGPWKARGVMIDPAIACIPHRPSMYTLGRTDESTPADDARADADAAGIATLRNDAPAVIRDLLARLADQARGLTVGAALLDPRFKPRAVVVEYREVFPPADGDTDPVVSDIYQIRSSVDDGITYAERRKWYDGKSGADPRWQRWREPGITSVDDLARPCRLVPLADADRNPAERGPL